MAFFGFGRKNKEQEVKVVNHMSDEEQKLTDFYNKQLLRAASFNYFSSFCRDYFIDCKKELISADSLSNIAEANFFDIDFIARDDKDKKFIFIHCLQSDNGKIDSLKLRDILSRVYNYSFLYQKEQDFKDYGFNFNFVSDKNMQKDDIFDGTCESLKGEGRFIKTLRFRELEVGENIKSENTLVEVKEFQKDYTQKLRDFGNLKTVLTLVGETYEDTYNYKQEIRNLGFNWDKEKKVWFLKTVYKKLNSIRYKVFKINRNLKVKVEFEN